MPEYLLNTDREIIIYGEPLFAEAAGDQLNLTLLEPTVDWLTFLPLEYSARRVEILTLGEARLGTEPAFVKPADGKIFEPKVYARGLDLPSDEQVDQDIQVLRSEIVAFDLEVRCFVRNRALVALSPYWRDGALAQDQDGGWPFLAGEEAQARSFAQSVVEDERVEFPPGCTLDVGRLDSGRWAVIEANPCWGAGLYGCEPQPVLETIRLSIIKKSNLNASASKWISKRRA